MGVNFWGALQEPAWPFLFPEKRLAAEQRKNSESALLRAIEEKGIQRLYSQHFPDRLTFLSGEKIIAVNPYQAGYLRYAQWVDGTDRPAYLYPEADTLWMDNLKALGGGYRKSTPATGFDLYTEFTPPPGPFVPLSRRGWSATASREHHLTRNVETQWLSDLYWAGNRLFNKRGNRFTYYFTPVSGRYLRLEQRGSDPTYYRSIHEIDLFGPPAPRTH